MSALEASDAQQTADIADLQSRVTMLEDNPLGLSGSIEVEYFVGRTLGVDFDVDRAYGLNNGRDMGASTFSSGAKEYGGDDDGDDGFETDVGEVAQDRADITQTSGDAVATLDLTLGLGTELDGAGSPNALNNFTAVISLSLSQVNGLNWDDGDFAGDPGYVFHVDEFTTTWEPIADGILTFAFGTDVETTFTNYVVATEDAGFVATVGSPDFLAFINPGLTVVYTTPAMDTYLRGAHLTLNPLEGVTLGGSFAQQSGNAADKDDVAVNNLNTTVFGVDGAASVSIFDLAFEYASGSNYDVAAAATTATGSVMYATLDVDGSALPILDTLSLNYRSIADNWSADGFNLGADADTPFAEDQTGFGVNADLSLFILDLSAYFDNYSVVADGGHSTQSFGVDASANLFAGFSLGGFFHQASVNGNAVDDLEGNVDANEAKVAGVGVELDRDNNYDTGFGVTLKHDGSADNALIAGLNLEAGYSQTEADYSTATIYAMGDFTLDVSILTLTPYASFKSVQDADVGTDDTTTIKVGSGITTTPLDVILKPSLMGAVNYRTTSHTDAAVYTATELQWSVGLVLNEFIFDNSVLTAKYGSWTGTNIQNANTVGADSASDISDGDLWTGADQSQATNGYEVIWNYWDLELAYGNYTNDNGGVASSAQAFRISYTVDF